MGRRRKDEGGRRKEEGGGRREGGHAFRHAFVMPLGPLLAHGSPSDHETSQEEEEEG